MSQVKVLFQEDAVITSKSEVCKAKVKSFRKTDINILTVKMNGGNIFVLEKKNSVNYYTDSPMHFSVHTIQKTWGNRIKKLNKTAWYCTCE